MKIIMIITTHLKKIALRNISICFIAALTLVTTLEATTFHVTTDGRVTNNGRSRGQAWPLFFAGRAPQLRPGDTVLIHPGVYNTRLRVERSGTRNNFITFRNASRDKPIIQGGDFGVSVQNRSWIKIQGLRVRNTRVFGILVEGPNVNRIEITRNDIENTGSSGIIVRGNPSNAEFGDRNYRTAGCNNVNVSFNTLKRVNTNGFNEAITVMNGCNNISTFRNMVDDNQKEAYNYKDYVTNSILRDNEGSNCIRPGIHLDARWVLRNITVTRNEISRCNSGIVVNAEINSSNNTMSSIRIQDNLFESNQRAGIDFVDRESIETFSGIRITDNRCMNNGLEIGHGRGAGVFIGNTFKIAEITDNFCEDNELDSFRDRNFYFERRSNIQTFRDNLPNNVFYTN